MNAFQLDVSRAERVGFGEAIFCAGKTPAQIDDIIADGRARGLRLLLTRLSAAQHAVLRQAEALDYDPLSATAFSGTTAEAAACGIAIVTAGTSDLPASREAARTLEFHGLRAQEIADVGVAGLWRLLARVEELRNFAVIIVAAGMDAALPTVLGGLVPGCIIAIPTSVGYGVATGGHTALNAMLSSCAPGVLVVNIDNGYGAACGAMRMARMIGRAQGRDIGI